MSSSATVTSAALPASHCRTWHRHLHAGLCALTGTGARASAAARPRPALPRHGATAFPHLDGLHFRANRLVQPNKYRM